MSSSIDNIRTLSESISFQNHILNKREIEDKKINLNSMPRVLTVSLTSRCNVRCIMCGVWELKEIWDIPQKAVSEIIGLFPYLERIYWYGGEPFLYENIDMLIEKAAEFKNLKQTVTTNGLLIDERQAEMLIRNNVDIIFSVDGVTEDVYENIRIGGKFSVLLNSIETVNRCREISNRNNMKSTKDPEYDGTKCILDFVLQETNYSQLGLLASFADRHKFDEISIMACESPGPCSPVQNGQRSWFPGNNQKIIKHIEHVLPEIEKEADALGIKLFHSFRALSTAGNPGTKPDRFCYWPWILLFVDQRGHVFPHGFCRQPLGDINTESLLDIWNNSSMQLYRQNILQNKNRGICNELCWNLVPELLGTTSV